MAEGFATRAIHAGRLPLPAEPPLATRSGRPRPSSSTTPSTTPTPSASRGRATSTPATRTRPRPPWRRPSPTRAAEGLATASGMGAIATVLLSLAGAGDHVVAQRDLYGGTHSLLAHTAPRFGIEVSFVDAGDPGRSGPPCVPRPGPSTPRRSPTRP